MEDVIKLYLFALRCGDRPLAEALSRALRPGELDAALRRMPRGATRWSQAAEDTVRRIMRRLC